jgi:hypothetical protein
VAREGGNCEFFTNLIITSNDGKFASWDTNYQEGCGNAPYFAIGRWNSGQTVMITLTPPRGYICTRWTFDNQPNQPGGETSGKGCVAIITLASGSYSPDWQNHLWFYVAPACQSECQNGAIEWRCDPQRRYIQKRTCGDFNSDGCFEWSNWSNVEDCGVSGWTNEYQCSGNWVQRKWIERQCSYIVQIPENPPPPRPVDCTQREEWRNFEDCSAQGKTCQNGQCVFTCSNECSYSGQKERRCSGNYVQERTCGNYDSDPCFEWSNWSNVEDCGDSGWTNEYRCSGNWVQRKYVNRGCSNAQCYANEEWRNFEDCSAQGKTCQNGQCITPPSPTLSVSLSANPSSGCSPLNNVDLTATVSGTTQGSINYYFDCQNDGVWDRTLVSSDISVTVFDLCNYPSPGSFTAKVRVERQGLVAENFAQISVQSCYSAPWVDLKVNGSDGPITIPYNSSATLTWNSANANYCVASGAWSGTKLTSGSESTGNLTSGPRTYTLTCYGPGGLASDSVTIYLQQVLGAVSPTIQKKVRNLSDGQTQYFDSVFADPSEVLEFQLVIFAGSGAQNVRVRDVLPDKLSLRVNSLKVDGIATAGDITSGIYLGNLSQGQTKVITFLADVKRAEEFPFGQTTLTNTATLYWNGDSVSDSVQIIVTKKQVAGAATQAPTGWVKDLFVDYLALPLLFASGMIYLFKSHILQWEEWLDKRKEEYKKYKSEKLLRLKIAQLRLKKLIKS